MLQDHEQKINIISKKLKERKFDEKIAFIRSVVSHQVPKYKGTNKGKLEIHVGNLNKILSIDEENKTCVAEPGVTFSALVRETLKKGLVPLVVPELKEITIGGAVAGCSIESMSYKVGGFHDNCLEYEIIDSKGNIIIATPENEYKEIFHMVHGTFGTVGLITKLKFKLIEAKPFVHVVYQHFNSEAEFSNEIKRRYEAKDCDFMDGIIHSNKLFTLCVANFTNTAPYTNNYDWVKIYRKSAEKRKEDYLTTYDYFFRYDAGCHWAGRNYGLENPIIRFLFGKIFLPSTNLLKLAKKVSFFMKNIKPDVVVDLFLPFSKWSDFWNFYEKELNYFPVWIVPYKIDKLYPWINKEHMNGVDDELYIDLAIYGMKQKDKNYYRLIEERMLKTPGMLKTLISYNYLQKDEFYKMWDKESMSRAKAITDPDGVFGDLYNKTCGG
jgi:FAD/FMN-containing dehydrogenase